MAEPFVGEICCFGFNFAPRGWLQCNGQVLSIASYTALYAIVGTTYGGNGTSTFGLPNLQGRVPMHWGTGPSGFNTVLGEVQGATNVTLTTQQIPSHTHQASCAKPGSAGERTAAPNAQSFLSNPTAGQAIYLTTPTPPNATFAANAISVAGYSIPHDNMQPYLVMNFCIAYEGVFPVRN